MINKDDFIRYIQYMIEKEACKKLTQEQLDKAWEAFNRKRDNCDMLFCSDSEDAKYDKELDLMEEVINEM